MALSLLTKITTTKSREKRRRMAKMTTQLKTAMVKSALAKSEQHVNALQSNTGLSRLAPFISQAR